MDSIPALISVITPFYKGNAYMERLIHTVQAGVQALLQEKPDAQVEMIIVNDSPDIPVQLPEIPAFLRVQVINHEKNGGIHKARVTGLLACTGSYVVFLDQDDELLPACFTSQLTAMAHGDLVVSNAYLEQEDLSRVLLYRRRGAVRNIFSLPAYVKGHNRIVSPGHCMLRRSAIPNAWIENIMQVNGADDLFLWILMFLEKKRIVFNNHPVYIHRYTGSNLSADESKMALSSIDFAERMRSIPYVPDKLIEQFIQNQRFTVKKNSFSGLRRLVFLLASPHIMIPRAFWKGREFCGRRCGGA